MEPTTITELFNKYAFPTAIVIVLIILLIFVLKAYDKTIKEDKEEVKDMNRQYHEDICKFSEVLNNNTNALNNMNKLVEYFVNVAKEREGEK